MKWWNLHDLGILSEKNVPVDKLWCGLKSESVWRTLVRRIVTCKWIKQFVTHSVMLSVSVVES